jgi:hypothetical protein
MSEVASRLVVTRKIELLDSKNTLSKLIILNIDAILDSLKIYQRAVVE